MMSRRSLLSAAALSSLAAACSPLQALNGLNRLTPGDGGVRQLVDSAAFGSDPRQRLDVWAPKHAEGKRPVIVFFYGGSWNSGLKEGYGFAARALAARGFVVVVPDYRLVPQVRWPGFVEDGAAAVKWTLANIAAHGGDPARVAVMGHSAGAHIALLLALDRRWGVADQIKAAVGLAGPYDFLPFTAGGAADAALGNATDLNDTQPIHFARKDAPLLLLLHGGKDTTVLARNSIRLANAVTDLGGKAEVRVYPDVTHIGILLALSKPFRGKATALSDASHFLAAALAP
ncbi:alpha/beta hydrolase [Sandarakinorhabdus oryzae]|uniref:alpha/beta hydrolase n=1 Tax=Sandarakinorhabdus oryzae TaxID=2675220 RepID=UPI0012E15398|nr:alpha/beta hydrolase [Sandarakinorhabdus oryzae]